MAAQPGEERILTVFADVHYYFNAPSPRPLAHRFDKGSYLYLYGNRTGSGARLEIANNAGTPEQDAFTGSLDSTTIRQSHKHPTLCTLVVDGYRSQHGHGTPPARRPDHHWKLPNTDPRNERTLLLHLHTIDIYFWTVQDAESFIQHIKRLLRHDQVVLLDMPSAPAPHEKVMSPVVQQLENAAIEDPAYHSGHSKKLSDAQVAPGRQETPKAAEPTTFQPLAYNPAAPAAPEPIRHREKTPPPDDADTGTGLAAAAYADHAQDSSQSSLSRPPHNASPSSQGYLGSPQTHYGHPGHGYVGSPPIQPHHSQYGTPAPGGYRSPVPSASGQRTSSVSSFPPPPPQSPPNATTPSNLQTAPASGPPSTNQALQHYENDGRPNASPSAQILGNSYMGAAHQPLQHVQPHYADYLGTTGHQSPAPVGGYSSYSYAPQPPAQQSHSPSGQYDVHNQVYRPTEEEAKRDKRQKPPSAGPGVQPGRLEQHAGKVDKGVNRLFKKLEKRIG